MPAPLFPPASRPFALLDRDGTIIQDGHYLSDPAQVRLLPHAAQGLRLLRRAGFGLVLVTNQSGVGRGYYTEADVRAVHARLDALLRPHGVAFDGVYFCPHAPDADCACRKPRPGMALEAARELGFSLERSAVIGDKACDVGLGRAVGARTVLVRAPGAPLPAACPAPDRRAESLLDAALWLVRAFCLKK